MRLALLFAAPLLAQHPEFMPGDECLFCHRFTTGSSWQRNAHALTVRQAAEGSDEYLLGRGRHTPPRKLVKAGFGQFALAGAAPSEFTDRCTGCHNTAIDPADRTFALVSIDCYSCHGAVDRNHSSYPALALLSRKRETTPATVASICGQCHLRGGKSRATGLPYANSFTAGGDLFADFAVDLSLADSPALPPSDRHVYRATRDGVSCLACHAVHAGSTRKHRLVLDSPICRDCHIPGQPRKSTIPGFASPDWCVPGKRSP